MKQDSGVSCRSDKYGCGWKTKTRSRAALGLGHSVSRPIVGDDAQARFDHFGKGFCCVSGLTPYSFTTAAPRGINQGSARGGISMSMFTRTERTEPPSLGSIKPNSNSKAAPSTPPPPRRTESSESGKSVISNDLKIIGQG